MMTTLSPTQLRDHRFTAIRVKAVEGGDISAEPRLEPSVWFEPVAAAGRQWRVILTVRLTSADPNKPFPYEADIQIQGLVEIKDPLPQERREEVSLVNGLSVLYSAVREMLLNITARSVYGAVTLPTLNFAPLVANARKQKAEKQRKTTRTDAT